MRVLVREEYNPPKMIVPGVDGSDFGAAYDPNNQTKGTTTRIYETRCVNCPKIKSETECIPDKEM